MSLLPQSELCKGGSKQKGASHNLNVVSKVAKATLEQPQKLMIDKKTYEDLMSYLVKAEVKRLKQKE